MPTTDAYQSTVSSLTAMAPELVLLGAAVAIMTAGAFLAKSRVFWARLTLAAIVGSALAWAITFTTVTDEVASVFINDAFSVNVRIALLIVSLIILGLMHDQVDDSRAPEYFGSFLFLQSGAMIVAGSNDLVVLFLGLELVSMPTYLLLYLSRRNPTTLEAATKYFFLSVFASAFFLYGIAFLYGQLGITQIKAIATVFHSGLVNVPDNKFALVAAFMIFIGIAYRVTAVPMHFYAPDVYEASPYATTAILSWFPKTVGFLALARVISPVYGHFYNSNMTDFVGDRLLVVFALIAAATLLVGNSMALLQTNIRRLLAYSSIAHSGFLLLGFIASIRQEGANGAAVSDPLLGTFGILYYLAAYGLMTLGAIGVLIALNTAERPVETIDDLAGLGKTRPVEAFFLAIFLFSLAGIPPLVGFWGKFYVFSALFSVASRESDRMLTYLAIFAALNAAVGVFYYLRVVVTMYLKSSDEPAAISSPVTVITPWPLKASILGCLIGTVVVGLFPASVSLPAQRSAASSLRLPVQKPILADVTPNAVSNTK